MKQQAILKSLLCIPALLFALSAVAESIELNDEESILIQEKPASLDGGPRMPSATRIEAYYDTEACSISVFLNNAGTSVTVGIVNLNTSEAISTVTSGSGYFVIPISGDAGRWTITFTLIDGRVFEGSFIL